MNPLRTHSISSVPFFLFYLCCSREIIDSCIRNRHCASSDLQRQPAHSEAVENVFFVLRVKLCTFVSENVNYSCVFWVFQCLRKLQLVKQTKQEDSFAWLRPLTVDSLNRRAFPRKYHLTFHHSFPSGLHITWNIAATSLITHDGIPGFLRRLPDSPGGMGQGARFGRQLKRE